MIGRVTAARLVLVTAAPLFLAAGVLIEGRAHASESPEHPAVETLLRQGRYADAAESAQAAYEAAAGAHGQDAPATADALDRLVDVLCRTGRGVEPRTRTLAERAVAMRRADPRGDEAGLAASLANLGVIQSAAAEFRPAQDNLEQALALRVKTAGPGAVVVAVVKERLGALLANAGNSARAKQLLAESVTALERDPQANGAELAASLTTLGGFLTNRGDLGGARDALGRALEIRTALYGPDHPETAATLFRQAFLKRKEGDPVAALDLARKVLAVRLAKLPPESPEIAAALGLSADLRFDRGDVPGARADAERALALRRAALGDGHPVVATSMKLLAGILSATGDYAGARPLFERSLAMERATLGPDHPQVALTLDSLGDVLSGIGDWPAAQSEYEQAVAIAERALPPEHPQRTQIVADLANVLAQAGREAEGRARLEAALASLQRVLGENHPQVGIVLHQLAASCERTGDDERGAEMALRAQSIFAAAFGPESEAVGKVLNVLGTIRRGQGRYAEAGDLLEHAVTIFEKALGPDHRQVGETLIELGLTRWSAGSPGPALACALRASRIRREELHNASGYLSEREALRYRALSDSALDLALSYLAARPANEPAPAADVERVWDEVVRSRAQVLDEVASRHRLALESGTPQGRALIAALEEARTRLARLAVAVYGAGNGEVGPGDLDRSRREKEDAERALAAWSAVTRESESLREVGGRQVGEALPPRSVLVSYVRYGRYAAPDPASRGGAGAARGAGTDPGAAAHTPAYLALVVRPPALEPEVVPLGDAATIDALVADWRKEASAPPADAGDAARYRGAAERLARSVWRPIAPRLKDVGLVLIVPDGALQFVSWNALPNGSGAFVGEGTARIHLLSAERDIVRAAVRTPPGRGLLALGGPDFDAGSAAAPASGRPAPPCAVEAPRFAPLPSAAAEAADVGRLWDERRPRAPNPEDASVILAGDRATEDSFRARAPGRRIIHLATHGYFLQEACHGAGADDALLRAGLALAGANRAWGPSRLDGARDGLLSAEEIASIDLRGVEWAVLSACGSSMGSVQAGEGVVGLRRAFEIAGARTLITSLWSLDDHTARQWIDALYEARLKGASTAAAVRAAGLTILRARRRAHLVDHPYYWAPFVAAGDWR